MEKAPLIRSFLFTLYLQNYDINKTDNVYGNYNERK